MAPGGVEPPHADSKSAALPLSYGANLQGEFARPSSRSWREASARRLTPPAAGSRLPGTRGVAEGTRTPDHRDHNPGLYRLSYRHRERRQDSSLAERRPVALCGRSAGGEVAPDERVDELLLAADELGAVALKLLGGGADGAHGLALVDQAAHLLAEGLDRGKLDDDCVHHDA